MDLRLATCSRLLGFSAFLYFNELINLTPGDIIVKRDIMTVKIACSKTDQRWQGGSVVVIRIGIVTCPVAMLEYYFSRTATAPSDKKTFCFTLFSQPKWVSF